MVEPRRTFLSVIVLTGFCATPLLAQAGDHRGEAQPPLPPGLTIPPAPALSPEDQLKTFVLAPGLTIELVAAEPLVRDPVTATFDARGRLWVAEMRSYMRDVDGADEDEPNGVIAVLSDTDGDGRMDKRVEFLTGLVLPRLVTPVLDGAVVLSPPDLFFARDTDGDGRADERTVIETGLGGVHSPEHAINGFIWNLDNWYRCANWSRSYRFTGDKWLTRKTRGGGQWGITQDDLGRVFFNTNSDPLRGDAFSSHYVAGQPGLGRSPGYNQKLVENFQVWPVRVTPGVNRGYQKGLLADGVLTTFTGACGPWILRGDGLGDEFQGNAFVCEPCGNLVKRYEIEPTRTGGLRAIDSYEGREFLASRDERFRPVSLTGGPDGALYIVDMYRGLIQHRLFVTTFLRKQVEERGLETPTALGRIWRVRRSGSDGGAPKVLDDDASWTSIVNRLGHANGFWRDTAQRILIEEGSTERDAIELTVTALRDASEPLARMHALWALEGMGALTRELVLLGLSDEDERVREAAVRVSESYLGPGDDGVLPALARIGREGSVRERLQVLYSLGQGASGPARLLLTELAREDVTSEERQVAIVAGLAGGEYEFLTQTLSDPEWTSRRPGRGRFWQKLAACVVRDGRGDRIADLVDFCGKLREPAIWIRPIVVGMLSQRGKGPGGGPGFIDVPREPAGLAGLLAIEDGALNVHVLKLVDALYWPERDGVERPAVTPLDEEQQSRFDEGRKLYAMICAQCHQVSGRGEDARAPSLRGTDWVLGRPDRLASLVLAGMNGAIEIDGRPWNLDMPAWQATDEELAAVLTYIRREWGNGADPVTLDEVAAGRSKAEARSGVWTPEDLRAVFK